MLVHPTGSSASGRGQDDPERGTLGWAFVPPWANLVVSSSDGAAVTRGRASVQPVVGLGLRNVLVPWANHVCCRSACTTKAVESNRALRKCFTLLGRNASSWFPPKFPPARRRGLAPCGRLQECPRKGAASAGESALARPRSVQHCRIARSSLEPHLPSCASKDGSGQVNDLGYGNNGGDWIIRSECPTGIPVPMANVHRLSDSGGRGAACPLEI